MRVITSGVRRGRHVDRAEIGAQLRHARRAGDHRRDMRVLRDPGDRHLSDRRAELGGDGFEPADRRVLRLVGQALGEPAHVLERAAAAGRDAAPVLAGQQAAGERAPGREAEADVLVEPRVFLLDALAMEQVVLRLLHHRLVQVVPVGDVPGGADVGRRPLAGAPVERLAARDHVAHRPDGLLDRRQRVGPMAVDEVDEIEAACACSEPSIACIRYLRFRVSILVDDGLPTSRLQAPEELGRDDVVRGAAT